MTTLSAEPAIFQDTNHPISRPESPLTNNENRLPLSAIASQTTPTAPAKTPVNLSREQILDATLSCLLESGYDGTTIRKIAKRLDCAVGSIYRYFKDKTELLDAVLQGRFAPVRDMLDENQSISSSVTLYLQTATEQPALYQLMFWIAADSESDPQAQQILPRIIGQIIGQWSTQLASDDKATALWAQLHGQVMLGGKPGTILDQITIPSENAHPAITTKSTSTPGKSAAPAPRLTPIITQSTPPAPKLVASAQDSIANSDTGYAQHTSTHEDITLL
ncbi:TetR/AcrR family transcriptional regulator [Poriferisphaera sp. WC338]|uniref:TetR/AcrR family transcriptional regulator n=1 Tax=Poriferisphaera sp. WC338 TaxID=3425129 RepID=UPI003D815D8F